MDCCLPGSSVHGIFQAIVLEWIAISFSKTFESESHSVVTDSLQPHGLYGPWNFPGQNTGVGSFSLLQGIFPTQGLNPGFTHCGQILYQLSIREAQEHWNGWPIPSPVDLPDPGIELGSLALQADSLPTGLSGKLLLEEVTQRLLCA